MRVLTIKDGKVENIAEFKEGVALPDSWLVAPDGAAIGDTANGDGTFSNPPQPEPEPPTPQERRDDALRNMVHDFGDGRVIQVRPLQFADDEANIRNAMERMVRLNITEQAWYMQDNLSYNVAIDDLQTALESAQDQGAQIWANFFTALVV